MTFDPNRAIWHITFGTYATRLHTDPRPTVDRRHNQVGEAFPEANLQLEWDPQNDSIILSRHQQTHIESIADDICKRGGWKLHAIAAATSGDHIHVLLNAERSKPSKAIRQWFKRWLGEALSEEFGQPEKSWWAEGGSTKLVQDAAYFTNVLRYIERQRSSDS